MNNCDVCGDGGGEHRYDILKHSGGGAVDTCQECSELAKRLATVVKEPYCLWCWEPTSGKYEWVAYGAPEGPRHRICGDCRKEIGFSNKPLSRGPKEVRR